MAKNELHKKTYWLYNHFFHFFDIPNFIPYKLKKKFIKYWNEYFISRDTLKDDIDNKEKDFESLNADNLINVINNLTTENENTIKNFEDIITSTNKNNSGLETSVNNFEDALKQILNTQESYNWKTI